MSVLKIMQTIKKRRLIPSHPLAAADETVKRACVSLWQWTAEADCPCNETEKNWLLERCGSLKFERTELETMVTGVSDEEVVVQTMEVLATVTKNPSRWLIFCECWLLAVCDGELQTEEQAFLELVAEFLSIAEGEAVWLKRTALALAAGNRAEFRTLACQGIQSLHLTEAVFWRVLLSHTEETQELKAFLADIYMDQGMEYERAGLDDEAVKAYEAALAIDTSCSIAYLRKGLLYTRQERWQAAMEEYETAVGISTGETQLFYQRGMLHQMLGDNEKALRDFNQAISLNPQFAALYHQRGQLHVDKKAYKLAIDDYEQAVDREPANDEYYHSLAYAYFHNGQVNQAILKISRAIDISPRNPDWYDSRAEFYLEQGNPDAALIDCAQALSLDEGFARAYYLRGIVQEKLNNRTASADSFQKYLALAGPDEAEVKEVRERLKAMQE